jgi:hypothetical protein
MDLLLGHHHVHLVILFYVSHVDGVVELDPILWDMLTLQEIDPFFLHLLEELPKLFRI